MVGFIFPINGNAILMDKKIFTIFAVICLVVTSADLLTTYSFTSHLLQTLGVRKDELHKIYQYEIFLSQLKDAETGQRGYIISGNPDYLLPYDSALGYFHSREVRDFIAQEEASDNPKTVERIHTLNKLTQKKLNELKETIGIRKNIGFEEARKMLIRNYGKKTMDEARQTVASIMEDKEDNLNSLEKKVKQTTEFFITQILVSNIIEVGLLIASLIYIYRYIQKLNKKDKELSQALQKLNESLAMREAILNSIHYAIISTDPQGIITSFNPAAEKMLGYTSQEMVGKFTPEIFHDKKEMEERAFALFNKLQRKISPDFEVFIALAKQDIPDINEWTYIRKDGARFPVQLSFTTIKNGNNEILGFVGIVYDITERKQFDRVKDELMNLTNYELTEPISAIKGCFNLLSLQSANLPDKFNHILEIGKTNCEYLINLTKDILEIQRIETGKVDFNFKKIDLSTLLPQVIQNNATLALQSDVSLLCSFIDPQCFVKADEKQLLQVMNRLISSAIKYSPPKGTVEITGQRLDSTIRIEVKDHGPSLSQTSPSETTFQKFTRASPSDSKKKDNHLGLNIVKSIIEKHKGRMGIQTNSTETALWFELPLFNI